MHKLYGTKPQAPKMLSPVLKAKKAGGPPVVDVRTAKMMNEVRVDIRSHSIIEIFSQLSPPPPFNFPD